MKIMFNAPKRRLDEWKALMAAARPDVKDVRTFTDFGDSVNIPTKRK